jgi:hypothetical protein
MGYLCESAVMGRPSKYTKAIVEEVCERLSKGEPLTRICRDEHMPEPRTIYLWAAADEEINSHIARAREAGEVAILEDCLNIADENGKDRRIVAEGVETTDTDVIQRAKLRIDTRLKLLAKWNPKKWGDKIDMTSAGNPIPAPIIVIPPYDPAAD